MMAAARIPADTDPALEQEIADLWADGFDSIDITVALTMGGEILSEADVCRVLAKQQALRLDPKAGGRADA
ncbi:hypothetical protein [Methylobacterium thuringiense]|uniref:Uncharacterized protein n=1 Tax=Methylobacterium thuringiense TaxID=1003091 RepID=A0ABQ4TGL9_9HYPH|nr:hypothetical protein [Methylobacterium thuringiense]GJE54554.1 hypothetical protein EKPJFOCH_1032 [Methylobacterium thuringiense]